MCGDRAGDAVSLMKLSKVAFQSQASLPLMPIIFIKVLYSLETLVGNLNGVEQKGNLWTNVLYDSAENILQKMKLFNIVDVKYFFLFL